MSGEWVVETVAQPPSRGGLGGVGGSHPPAYAAAVAPPSAVFVALRDGEDPPTRWNGFPIGVGDSSWGMRWTPQAEGTGGDEGGRIAAGAWTWGVGESIWSGGGMSFPSGVAYGSPGLEGRDSQQGKQANVEGRDSSSPGLISSASLVSSNTTATFTSEPSREAFSTPCFVRLFFGQLPLAIKGAHLQQICDVLVPGVTLYAVQRIVKWRTGEFKGCVHVHCFEKDALRIIAKLHERVVFDRGGVWCARNEAEAEEIKRYAERLRARRQRPRDMPWGRIVVQRATSAFVPVA